MEIWSVATGAVLGASLLAGAVLPAVASALQQKPQTQLPSEVHGKAYKLPDDSRTGKPVENPALYRKLSLRDVNLEGLMLDLSVSMKPVDRVASIRKIYFQNLRANGIPFHIETFEQEFKLSKTAVVDLPAPLRCSIVFTELDSLKPVLQLVQQDRIQITGQSFVEVKLNPLEKMALRAKQLILPVQVKENVPLNMFSDNPLLRAAAIKILDTLSDPSTAAAAALARERLANLGAQHTVEATGRGSVFLLYCEYALRDPKSQAEEKFTQSGTGFAISADGKLLTAKRVVQPWKFDPQIARLMQHHQLELDPNRYKIWAWPAGASVASPDERLNFQAALGTDHNALKLLRTAADKMEEREFQDPDSGAKSKLSVHAPGENDVALLQLVGRNVQPLSAADAAPKLGPELKTTLLGYPYGVSQAQANPQPVLVAASASGSLIAVDHELNPGEYGAPLLTPDGKVIAIAGGSHECIPIGASRSLVQ